MNTGTYESDGGYILRSCRCDDCIFGEKGFYNPICAHCPDCSYSKSPNTRHMTRAEGIRLGAIKKESDSIPKPEPETIYEGVIYAGWNDNPFSVLDDKLQNLKELERAEKMIKQSAEDIQLGGIDTCS